MMTAQELKRHRQLPEMLTVYRGCYPVNERGLSWTLDRAVAERFPGLHRYRHYGQPRVLTGRVRRDQTVLKLDRNEQEIIAPIVRIRTRELLSLEMAA